MLGRMFDKHVAEKQDRIYQLYYLVRVMSNIVQCIQSIRITEFFSSRPLNATHPFPPDPFLTRSCLRGQCEDLNACDNGQTKSGDGHDGAEAIRGHCEGHKLNTKLCVKYNHA